MYSVVIPYYNHKQYLNDLFSSLEVQKSAVGEIIIVDDGSPDDGLEDFLRDYHSDLNVKIKTFRQANGGTSSALNFALSKISYNKIAILNSDDYFSPFKLDRCDQIFAQKCVEFIFGAVSFVDGNGCDINNDIDAQWYKKGLESIGDYHHLIVALFQENFAVTSSNFVFTRDLLNKVGPFHDFRYANDLDFLIRSLLLCKFFFDKEVVHVCYRYHNNNTIKENIELTTSEVRQIAIAHQNQIINLGVSAHSELLKACEIRGFSL